MDHLNTGQPGCWERVAVGRRERRTAADLLLTNTPSCRFVQRKVHASIAVVSSGEVSLHRRLPQQAVNDTHQQPRRARYASHDSRRQRSKAFGARTRLSTTFDSEVGGIASRTWRHLRARSTTQSDGTSVMLGRHQTSQLSRFSLAFGRSGAHLELSGRIADGSYAQGAPHGRAPCLLRQHSA